MFLVQVGSSYIVHEGLAHNDDISQPGSETVPRSDV